MKKIIVRFSILALFLFVCYIVFLFIFTFVHLSNRQPSQPEEGYLNELNNQYSFVIDELEKQDISASYDDIRQEIKITTSEANYYFSSKGAKHIGVKVAPNKSGSIAITSISDKGRVEEINVYFGDALGSIRNKYNMDNLDKPKAYFWGDDAEYAEKIIKEDLPNEKIKEIISQAEKYQKIIKEIINEKNH